MLIQYASWSLFLTFWPKSRRFRDLRRATAAARPAGHHGLISFLNGGLLSRSAAESRIGRLDITSTETVRNANRPRIALEVLGLKTRYYHSDQRVALTP